MMNCINGLYKPQKGSIYYKGQRINSLRPYRRAELGISRTFQKLELFGGMSVLDNIRLGRHIHLKSGIVSGSIYGGRPLEYCAGLYQVLPENSGYNPPGDHRIWTSSAPRSRQMGDKKQNHLYHNRDQRP